MARFFFTVYGVITGQFACLVKGSPQRRVIGPLLNVAEGAPSVVKVYPPLGDVGESTVEARGGGKGGGGAG